MNTSNTTVQNDTTVELCEQYTVYTGKYDNQQLTASQNQVNTSHVSEITIMLQHQILLVHLYILY